MYLHMINIIMYPCFPEAKLRGVNREVSMLQQQSAIYQARTYALSNGSMETLA